MNINEYLKNRNIKISDISKYCNIPYATIHGGFDNPDSIKTANLKKIADFLEIGMDELYDLLQPDETSLLTVLLDQKRSKLKGNIYHYTQIKFTYNSNRIEGSKLSEEETRYIFETNTLFSEGKVVENIDDIVETSNHFYLFDIMLEEVKKPLTEDLIKRNHGVLKNGTADARKEWFNVGEYKKLPNEVGGKETTKPEDVSREIKRLLEWYNGLLVVSFDDLLEFHYRFESIHPFQDGNGRIGRLIMFRECLKHDIVPFIIEDEYKLFYYRGLSEYESEKGYLRDTCLSMQDRYEEVIRRFLGDMLDG